MKNSLLLIVIILFGFLIRIIGIDLMPPSLNWDEVNHGYNAYSILNSGKDEWGQSLPIIFRAYGDYKLPVYIYATVPTVALFGLTPLGVRLPSIIAGSVSILLIYLLCKKLFEKNEDNQSISLFAAFLFAVTPWSLFLSRVALEANLALTFILAGLYFYLTSFNKSYRNLIFSAIFFGLSVWTYNSARIFVPLLIFGLIIIHRKEIFSIYKIRKSIFVSSVLIAAIFFIPMFLQLLNPVGSVRYKELQIIDQGAIAQIEEVRNNSTLPSQLNRVVNNKVVYFISVATKQYINHFSPEFLFITGGDHYQFSVPQTGLIYVVLLPFALIGLLVCLKKVKNKNYQLLVFWLLTAPIASSVTRDSPHVLRSFILFPVIIILCAVGIIYFINWVSKFNKDLKITSTIIILTLIFLSFGGYVNSYVTEYRNNYSWAWQYGYKEVAEYAKQNYDKYDSIIMTKKYGEPHEFVLFYNNWNPDQYRDDSNLIRFNQSNWWWTDRFDKYNFINDWQVKELKLESGGSINCEDKKCLLITSSNNSPAGWSKLETINFLDGNIAFEIYEN